MRGRFSTSSQWWTAHAVSFHLLDLDGIDTRLAPLVDTARPGVSNSFKLALAAQVSLELSEDAKHVQKAFTRRRAGVDWLLGGL
jgi:hypothetical protein